MKPGKPDPVKLFCGVLHHDSLLWSQAKKELTERFGPIDFESRAYSFDVTTYYEEEMGQGLVRQFVCFERLIDPGEIAEIKLFTNEVEDHFLTEGKRPVNLDPGYMDFQKLILASAKPGGYKVYHSQGIWADPTLYYEKGRFHEFHWGFPDFRSGQYNEDLLEIRRLYKQCYKNLESAER